MTSTALPGFSRPNRRKLRRFHWCSRRGLGIQTPSRTFASAIRNVNGLRVSLPIEGESAAPDIATAAGSVTSRSRSVPTAFS